MVDKFTQIYSTDFRFRWPERMFKHICRCKQRFWGPDCGECWYGYSGPNCTKRVTYIRRNLLQYSKSERRRLLDVFAKVREVKSDYVVPQLNYNETRISGKIIEVDPQELLNFMHYQSSVPMLTVDKAGCKFWEAKYLNYGHFDIGFPFYHRYLLMFWERQFRRVAVKYFDWDDFTFPYWDWTNSRKCDICTDDLIGTITSQYSNISDGYFISPNNLFGSSKWNVSCLSKKNADSICSFCTIKPNATYKLTRKFIHYEFPTTDEIIELLKTTVYENYQHDCQSFEHIFETSWNCTCSWKHKVGQLHVKIHGALGGAFNILSASAYEPLFLLFHVQVDRLFERWYRGQVPSVRSMSNIGKGIAQCRDCYIPMFLPPVSFRDLYMDTRRLGYSYDNFSFGPLSEDVKVSRFENKEYVKKCQVKIFGGIQLL